MEFNASGAPTSSKAAAATTTAVKRRTPSRLHQVSVGVGINISGSLTVNIIKQASR